jgi:hypothetical protein
MTIDTLYYPFQKLSFEDNICFLSGVETTEKMTVFPAWFMEKYNFNNDDFEMMDKLKSLKYKDLSIPCSEPIKKAFDKLDVEIKNAFENGYDCVVALESKKLYLWIGRIVYGTLYHEIEMEKKRCQKYNKEYTLSPFLKERFGLFHLFLQSIIAPIEFVGKTPWEITIVRHKFSDDIMNYRDDTVNLMFSLATKDFAIIACLQDNGIVAEKHKEIVDKIGDSTLHPIQFEELYARFHYANYLLQYEPKFSLEKSENSLTIQSLAIIENTERPIFGFWDEDMFASVLAGYWEVYGITKNNILKFPNPIMSFLEDPYSKDFFPPEKIKLPF